MQISDFFDRTEELFREMQWQKKLRGNKLETLIIFHSGVENVFFWLVYTFFLAATFLDENPVIVRYVNWRPSLLPSRVTLSTFSIGGGKRVVFVAASLSPKMYKLDLTHSCGKKLLWNYLKIARQVMLIQPTYWDRWLFSLLQKVDFCSE